MIASSINHSKHQHQGSTLHRRLTSAKGFPIFLVLRFKRWDIFVMQEGARWDSYMGLEACFEHLGVLQGFYSYQSLQISSPSPLSLGYQHRIEGNPIQQKTHYQQGTYQRAIMQEASMDVFRPLRMLEDRGCMGKMSLNSIKSSSYRFTKITSGKRHLGRGTLYINAKQ